MRKIILHTAKAIARDKRHPGKLIFTDSGAVLGVPSRGVTATQADDWIADGTAAPYAPPKAE